MTSHPPGKCCTTGVRHEGSPLGNLVTIGDSIQAYTAVPPPSTTVKGGICYMPDLFGIYNNSKLVADDFASNGYLTIIPDIFLGDAMPPDVFSNPEFDVMKWIASNQPDKVDPVWSAAVSYLKSLPELSGKKIAAVGYCYGAKFACRALGNGTIDAAYVAHPSFVTVEELAAIKGPLSISAAETDPIFPVEKRIESEDILNGIGAIYQINLFSGVGHGFAVRADISDPVVKFAKEQAFFQAVAWFNTYLVK